MDTLADPTKVIVSSQTEGVVSIDDNIDVLRQGAHYLLYVSGESAHRGGVMRDNLHADRLRSDWSVSANPYGEDGLWPSMLMAERPGLSRRLNTILTVRAEEACTAIDCTSLNRSKMTTSGAMQSRRYPREDMSHKRQRGCIRRA